MSLNAPKSEEEKRSSHEELKEAQDALDRAVQPNEPGRAGIPLTSKSPPTEENVSPIDVEKEMYAIHFGMGPSKRRAVSFPRRYRGASRKLEKEFVDSVNAAGQATGNSDGLGILMDGVNSLVESLPPLVRALDAVAQLHPFLALAVGAFKVVVELEAKRRDNDKKVNLLFLEMRNMMAALLQLQGVRTNHVGRDGLSIGARLDDLVKKTAKDIKECANACDTYSRKRLLVKVLKAPSWDGTLKEYIQLFSDRKGEFNFAISIHTGLGVDRANDKLDTLITKVDVVIAFFEKTAPREQRALAEAIRQEGGAQAVLAKSDVLQELLLKEQQLEAAGLPCTDDGAPGTRVESGLYARKRSGAGSGAYYYSRAAENQRVRRCSSATRRGEYGYRASYAPPRGVRERSYGYMARDQCPEDGREGAEEEQEGSVELKRLMQDLADEPAVAIRKNFVWFARKFAIQQREIVLEMTAVVVHEGDRVISSVLAGPHERIIDPDLYKIWKEMRWRGIVKARHLVLAIHDYYTQRLDDQRRAVAQGAAPQRPVSESDVWALECIDLMHLQQITEAFDADASGFITTQEVNYFTTSRPKGWSLLHWLAYWAVGWQVVMTEYRSKIYGLLARMGDFRSSVRGRGPAVEKYLDEVVPLVKQMTKPFREDPEHRFLLDRFRGYAAQEEQRLREGLETAKYDLDALDTLALINGPKGLERNLFIILYLLLRRHYDIMSVGKKVILHPEELSDAAGAIQLVKDAFDYRAQDLIGLFTQRRLQVYLEVSDFACGMLSESYARGRDYDSDTDTLVGTSDDLDLGDVGDEPSEAMLKYPPHSEVFYPENEDGVDSEGTELAEELKPLLGHWAGVQTSEAGGTLSRQIFSFDFHASPTDAQQVIAVPLLNMPWTCTRATLTGTFTGIGEDGHRMYLLSSAYNTSTLPAGYTKVALSEDGSTLVGKKDVTLSFGSSGPKPCVVARKGSSPDIMQFYPRPSELQDNKASVMWRFAISAVLYDVCRRRLSWEFIKERRDRKHSLASLLLAESRNGLLYADDVAERVRLVNATTPADLHYFAYASVEPARFPWVRPWCAECKRVLRTVQPCLRCALCVLPGEIGGCAALCDRVECLRDHHLGYGDHRILKTREVGWALEAFMKDRGFGEGKLMRLYSQAAAAVGVLGIRLERRGRSPSPPRYMPQQLSTISEVTEPVELQRGRPGHGPVVVGLPASDGIVGGVIAVENVPQRGRLREMDTALPPFPTDSPYEPVFGFPDPDQEASSTEAAAAPNEDTPPSLRCINCNERITATTWVCVECSDPTYICLSCDEREGGLSLGVHEANHVLLRIGTTVPTSRSPSRIRRRSPSRYPVAVPVPMPDPRWQSWPGEGDGEERRGGIKDRLGSLESRFGRIEERMEGFENQLAGVDGRLERIDNMLTAVLSLLHGGASPSN